MRRALQAVLLFALASGGCSPQACRDADEREIRREVEFLAREPGPNADAAERSLLARGSESILFLEAGLYESDAYGRRRIAKVLTKIGDPEALPVLRHLEKFDPDDLVRDAAASGARKLTASHPN